MSAAAADGDSPRVFASLGARLAAGLIDLAVITLPSLIIARMFANAPYRVADLAIIALTSAYFILSCSSGGGYSAGKLALGIRVVNRNGGELSVVQATVRWFFSIGIALPLAFLAVGFERGTPVQTGTAFAICVPILCVVVVDSYLTLANRVSHRSLHDLAAGSFVVRRTHTGAVPATPPLDRRHFAGMALCCALAAIWFGRAYPWTRVIGQRSVELMKARTLAIASGKASTLILAPGFSAQGADTVWLVSAIATIHAAPQTAFEAEALRKALACSLVRAAPSAFRGAELDLTATFDAAARATRPSVTYFADLELTPQECTGK